MSWLRIEDGFAENEKIIDLSDRSFRIHVAALCYCARNLTDGILGERQIAAVCAITRGTRRNLAELVDAGLWHQDGPDYIINDYLEYNPTSSEVKELRRARAEAGRRGGKASGQARAKANASASASSKRPSNVVEPHPVPSHKDLKPLQASVTEIVSKQFGTAAS